MEGLADGKTRLALVDLEAPLCFAQIGALGKLCLSRNCAVAEHSKKQRKSLAIKTARASGQSKALLVVAKYDAKGDPTTVFGSPYLDATNLSASRIEGLLSEERTPHDWAQVLGMFSEAEKEDLTSLSPLPVDDVDGRARLAEQPMKTPRKELRFDEALQVPESESPDIVLAIVDDKKAQENFSALKGLTGDVKSRVATLEAESSRQFVVQGRLADKVNSLQMALGGGLESYPSITQAVGQLFDSTADINSRLLSLSAVSLDAVQRLVQGASATASEGLNKIQADMINKFTALGLFIKKHLVEPFIQLRSDFQGFRRQVEGSLGAATVTTSNVSDPLAFMGLSSHAPPQPAAVPFGSEATLQAAIDAAVEAAVRERVAPIQEELAESRAQVATLSARSYGSAVTIGGIISHTFENREAVRAFVKTNKASKLALAILDVHSYLQVCFSSSSPDAHSKAKIDDHTGRLSLSPFEMIVLHSFQVELPVVFSGPSPSKAMGSNRNKLPACSSFKLFDGDGTVESGLRGDIKSRQKTTDMMIASYISMSGANPVVEKFLLQCAELSSTFVTELVKFMETQYRHFAASSSMSDEQRWALVELLVRIVFRTISEERCAPAFLDTKNVHSDESVTLVWWSSLQAHRVMADYIDHEFKRHPTIGPLIVGQVLDVMAFSEDVEKVRADVLAIRKKQNELGDRVEKIDKKFDKAANQKK